MDGTEIGIFEKPNEISFRSFLESEDGGALESKFLVKGMGDFSYKPLEGKLSKKKVCSLLISSDLPEGNGSWSESLS